MNSLKSAALAVSLCLISLSANAVTVSSSVGDYNVLIIAPDVSFNAESALLMSQVWWDDQLLAQEFADLVGISLGLQQTDLQGLAPFFVWGFFQIGPPPPILFVQLRVSFPVLRQQVLLLRGI